ncbi:hypothetical protein HYV80_03755 [Candidatus Woesearchaeota archaeon]|nr:hypothetical protein [Candidatus Woesearchaeota archaeon]
MQKLLVIVMLVFFISGCKPQESPKIEPFCGDDICQAGEEESGCKEDCGGFEGIAKLQCAKSGGSWNDCGSPCIGTGADICIQVCSPQCECSGIAGFNCPDGYKCRLTGRIADEMGVCIRE